MEKVRTIIVKKTFQLFLADMKNIGINWVAAILIGGLIILPSLYAWFNIAASWDPYGQTEQIPIGVVNEDKGATVRGEDIDVGKELVDTLKDSDDMDWQFVDRKKAMEKVEYGDYFAVIVIPEDFSENLGTVVKDDPEKATVEYYVNEKINAIAPKITEKWASVIVDQVSSNFISTVNGVIFDMFNEIGLEIEKDMPDIEQFEDYIFTLEEDLPDIHETLNDTLSDANDAEDIISKAQNMMPEVKDTTQSGLETIDETMSFLKEAEDRLNEMAPEIEEDLKTAQSIADDVNSFIDDIKNVDIDFSEGKKISGKIDERIEKSLADIAATRELLKEVQAINQENQNQSPGADENAGGDGAGDDNESDWNSESGENGIDDSELEEYYNDHSEDIDDAIEKALNKLDEFEALLEEMQHNSNEIDSFVENKKAEVDDNIDNLQSLAS